MELRKRGYIKEEIQPDISPVSPKFGSLNDGWVWFAQNLNNEAARIAKEELEKIGFKLKMADGGSGIETSHSFKFVFGISFEEVRSADEMIQVFLTWDTGRGVVKFRVDGYAKVGKVKVFPQVKHEEYAYSEVTAKKIAKMISGMMLEVVKELKKSGSEWTGLKR